MTRTRNAYALAALSGVLLALSFPRFGHPAVAWIALVPLLIALNRGSLRHAFGLGLTTASLYFAGTLYWITRVMSDNGGLPTWVAVLINAGLILDLAIFPIIFAVVTRRIVMAFGSRALVVAPLVWVTSELGRTYLLFGGFPWVLLGHSQATVLPIAQLASLFGVYGISVLIVSVNAGLAIVAVYQGPLTESQFKRYGPVVAALTLVFVVAFWGSRRAARAKWTRAGDPVTVGLVQGNVDQGEKWTWRALRRSSPTI